jgi:uncharacterized membrane protein
VAALLFLVSPAAHGVTSQSLEVRVYADGTAYITQTIEVDPSSASVQVPLLSSVLSDVVVKDQNGSPLSYTQSGSNMTIYTLGATGATIRYDTPSLTNKTGTVWTLQFATKFNTTVVLPQLSTLSYTSGTPYSLQQVNKSPVLTMGAGTWKFGYGVAIGNITATSTGTGPGLVVGLDQTQLELAGALVAAAAGGVLIVRWWRRRVDLGPEGKDLRPDDLQVINFIQEKGGKVLEPEIRTRFALPKTSAWRQIKRLERLGYVKVTKIGSQNQIELLRKREQGT